MKTRFLFSIAFSLFICFCAAQSNSTEFTSFLTTDDENNTEDESFYNSTSQSDLESEEEALQPPRDPSEFMDYYEDLMVSTKERLEGIFEQYMPQLLQMSSSVTLSQNCMYDAFKILLGLRQLKPWAIKIIDASGKIPDGILGGTLTALGSYDECLQSRIGDQHDSDADDSRNKGQYCAVNIRPFLPPKPPLNILNKVFNDAADAKGFSKENHFARIAPLFYYLKVRLGLCVPASCSLNDLNLITKSLSSRVKLNVTVENCNVQQSISIENDQIVPITLIIGLIIVVVLATSTDLIRRSRFSDASISMLTRLLLSFSLNRNSATILSSKISTDSIKPLYGLRVLSLVWIILAHTYLTMDFRATGRLLVTQNVPKGFFFQIILNASLAIETFFFLSGLLVAYTTLKKMNSSLKWGKANWLMFYFHRYARMTPAIMMILVILLSIYRTGDGPLWKEIIYPSVAKCKKNWWKHLLYINNLDDARNMCFLHLWYIAADMQLFIVTPFFLTLLHLKPRVGKALIVLSIVASIVCTSIITYLQDLPPTLLFNNPDPSSRRAYGNLLFVKPYSHAAPYLIGMLTGYLLFKNTHLKLTRKTAWLGWIMSTIIVLSEVFTTWEWNKGNMPNGVISALYAGFFRIFWASSMAWIVIACQNGFGGIINSILTLPFFVPLSRMSYIAYLIHPGLMYVFVASTRNIFAFSHYFVIQLFFSHLTTTFIASYILSLTIEYPFITMERILHDYLLPTGIGRKKLYAVNSSSASDITKSDKDVDDLPNKQRFSPPTSEKREPTRNGLQFVCREPVDQSNLVFTYRL